VSAQRKPFEISNSFLEDCDTPVGHLLCAGTARHAGIPVSAMRVLNAYGVIVLLEGGGRFLDANRYEAHIEAGDCILLFPDIAHSYGPPAGGHWSEWFFHFKSPAFDLWRGTGLLDPFAPVLKGASSALLLPLREIAARPSLSPATHLGRVCDVLRILGAVRSNTAPTKERSWLEHAQHILSTEVNEDKSLEKVARKLGMSCSTFRARFLAESGQTPGHFRALARVQTAQQLLERPELSTKAIASSLGWSDEFAFSKNFKRLCGQTPHEFRRALKESTQNS
jgi:AraC-like DNA-binding protein